MPVVPFWGAATIYEATNGWMEVVRHVKSGPGPGPADIESREDRKLLDRSQQSDETEGAGRLCRARQMEARLTMKAPRRSPFASTLTFRLALGALAAAGTLAACDDSGKDIADAGDAARPDGPATDTAPGEVAARRRDRRRG